MSNPASLVLNEQIEDWHQEYLSQFKQIACAADFPCMYIGPAFEKGHIKFHFLKDPGSEVERMQSLLSFKQYVRNVLEEKNQRTAAMMILILVVHDEFIVTEHERCAWSLLDYFLKHDDVPWPERHTRNPDDADWAYCFQGQRIFVNISSPDHKKRLSRNLGRHLALVLQLRDGVDYIAPPDAKGDQIRGTIRSRIEKHDHIGVSPDLSTHGQGENRDWKQFWLGDREEVLQGKCPISGIGQ